MRGRKPKPTGLRLIEGNPGKRDLPEDEPEYEESEISAPEYIEGEALSKWEEMAPMLINSGILTIADRDMLAAYCMKFAHWQEMERLADEHPDLVKTPNGHLQQSPYISMANKAFEQLCKLAVEFGLTPSSRTRVKATGKKPKKSPASSHFD